VTDGHDIVVDVMMSRLAQRIGDKRLLRIVRRFLASGMMQHGVSTARYESTPQGRSAVAAAHQSAAGRSGQGTRTSRPPLLPICRRLQYLPAGAQNAARHWPENRTA
jgi:hypothetical protein